MLLVIDIGNTNTVFGVYAAPDQPLFAHFRIQTSAQRTADEYGIIFRQLLEAKNIVAAELGDSIIASVVPTLTSTFAEVCRVYCGGPPLLVGPGCKTGMPILYENPKEVGADRIVNAVAAFEWVHDAVIVVDLGTATTFDAVSAKGEYLGGAIAPGIGISTEALFMRASKLPRVEIVRPKSVIGKTTVQSMQAGILFGYVGLIDGVVNRMREEMGGTVRVVATGGLAPLVAADSSTIEQVDEFLTLEGLRLIWQRNQ